MDYDIIFNEVIGRLDTYKQNSDKIKNTDLYKSAASKMIYKYEVNNNTLELSDEFKNSLEKLKEAGLNTNEIMNILSTASKEMQIYISEAKKEIKTIQETNEEIFQQIGKIMLDEEKLTERSLHFPHIGTVKVVKEQVISINDEDKVKEEIAKSKELREKYLKLSKTITKYKDAKDIDGITTKEEYKVTIKADK